MYSLWVLRILLGFAVASAAAASPAMAQQLDLYVLYTSGNRAEKDELLSALPGDLSVKVYNTNLLALADYSAKQRTMAKLETARIVVILNTGPMEHLDGKLTGPDVIIFNSAEDRLWSDSRTVHVVSSGTDRSTLGSQLRILDLEARGVLEEPSLLRDADVISVSSVDNGMLSQLAEIIEIFLGRRITANWAAVTVGPRGP